jgi:hypothetical protein
MFYNISKSIFNMNKFINFIIFFLPRLNIKVRVTAQFTDFAIYVGPRCSNIVVVYIRQKQYRRNMKHKIDIKHKNEYPVKAFNQI